MVIAGIAAALIVMIAVGYFMLDLRFVGGSRTANEIATALRGRVDSKSTVYCPQRLLAPGQAIECTVTDPESGAVIGTVEVLLRSDGATRIDLSDVQALASNPVDSSSTGSTTTMPNDTATSPYAGIRHYFRHLGHDKLGEKLRANDCALVYLPMPNDVSPRQVWKDFRAFADVSDLTPTIARKALVGICSPYVDTSYRGNALNAPSADPQSVPVPEGDSLDPCSGEAFPFEYALSVSDVSGSTPGDVTTAVTNVQRILRSLGYTGLSNTRRLTVDGWYGQHTRYAVENFQRDHGIDQTGAVYTQTWAALGEAC